MNGDTFSIKAPKECSKKFAATFKGKFLTRGNVLRTFSLFLEDFGAPLQKRCRHSSGSDDGLCSLSIPSTECAHDFMKLCLERM